MKQLKLAAAMVVAVFGFIPTTYSQWSLSGNSISSGQFLGTTNSQPFEIKRSNSTIFKSDLNGNFTLGDNITNYGASDNYAIGKNIQFENQMRSFAFGSDITNTDDGGYSQDIFSIGRFILNGGYNKIVIGKGVDASNPIDAYNFSNEGLFVGFNSNLATLYVGSSSGVGTTGNVGIGTINPSVKFEVASPYAYNASGTVVKLGGKSSWNTNDYERFQLGFSQLQSIYNGSGWDFSVNTGSSNGTGVSIKNFI